MKILLLATTLFACGLLPVISADRLVCYFIFQTGPIFVLSFRLLVHHPPRLPRWCIPCEVERKVCVKSNAIRALWRVWFQIRDAWQMPYIDLFNRHTSCSQPGMTYPSGCAMYVSSSMIPLRNALLTSRWISSRSLSAAIAMMVRRESYRTTGASLATTICGN